MVKSKRQATNDPEKEKNTKEIKNNMCKKHLEINSNNDGKEREL